MFYSEMIVRLKKGDENRAHLYFGIKLKKLWIEMTGIY